MKSPFTHIRTVVPVLALCAKAVFAAVSVISPGSGVSVPSPVHFLATATSSTCAQGVASIGIYINNQLTYFVDAASLDTSLPLNPGSYGTVVEERDRCGGATYTPVAITVIAPNGVSVSSPKSNSTYASPVPFTATARSACANGVAA